MALGRWLLRHIVLVWGLLVFVSGMAIVHLDLQYDGGGLETLVSLFFHLLGQPAFFAQRMLEMFGMAPNVPTTTITALVFGLVLCIAGDLCIQMLLSRRRAAASAEDTEVGSR